jgi:hypothetical protein
MPPLHQVCSYSIKWKNQSISLWLSLHHDEGWHFVLVWGCSWR